MAVYKRIPTGAQWPTVDVQSYVNLATVESIRDFPNEKKDYCTIALMHSKMEEVKKLKKTIGIDEVGTCMWILLKTIILAHRHVQVGLLENGQKASCIIVEGIPGIGKSTFSWHVGVCWAQKKILHDYHLVVLLRLRDESVQRATCVSDLFCYKEQPKQEHEAVIDWIRSRGGDGVMLVLDGYDELSSHVQTSSIFADIIKGETLPKMTVLVSSRASANQNLCKLCNPQRCQYIEVLGFGKEEIVQYIDVALKHNKELRNQLMSYIEHHPHIHGLMYCPLNCAIIVQIFRDQMKMRNQPPQTHTEVYQVLIKTVLKRHEKNTVKSQAAKSTSTTSSRPNCQFTYHIHSCINGVLLCMMHTFRERYPSVHLH